MDILTPDKAAEIYLSLGYPTLEEYQKAYNLPATGVIDNATERSLLATRHCQLPEFITLDATRLRKWPRNKISWAVHSNAGLPGFTRDDLYSVFRWAFDRWSDVADLTFNNAIPGNITDILITTGRIDAAGNTLAWSELPGASIPGQQTLTQKFDSQEPFVFTANPPPSKIDLGAVACHEIGHALGLDHLPSGSRNLLAPIYSPAIRTPQGGDIAEIQRRYGKPSQNPSVPTPTPNPPPTGENPVIPLPFDPNRPDQTIFPPGLALPKLAGYTWIAVPSGHIPPTRP